MAFLKRRWPAPPRVGVVLGSGLGRVADELRDAKKVPYQAIPHFARPTVDGHAGTLHLGLWRKVPVAVLQGRLHVYEGYTPDEVVFPMRVLGLAGIKTLVLTCAAGGIASTATPGSLMIFADHLNLQGLNPLAGSHDERWGPRFPDMTQAYDAALRRVALRVARKQGLHCFAGVYAALLGPSYETPAEIRSLQRLGADAVGMSTVPEVIVARQMGMRVLAVAAITNRAAGLAAKPLSHQEVLAAGARAARSLTGLLRAVVPAIA
ncbi:MAG: purine-nucleoside phosphorylase [Acidobacteriia bacterium]|nr:purine-nucleoside phosphorylase [Terriglobia bacterium]